MAKTRKDPKGRGLNKGETYKADRGLYCYTYVDPIGKRRSIYSKDLMKLREKEDMLILERIEGLDSYARAKCDLNYVFDRYLNTKSVLRSSTKSSYIFLYNRHVRDTLGRRKIADIRYSDVLYFYQYLLDRGFSAGTVKNVQTLIRPAFQMAVRDDILNKNPTDGVLKEIRKSPQGKPEPRHPLTLEEERAFLNHLELPKYWRWKPLFTFMFGTGCRAGETIAIRWQDIDFDAGEICINHSVSYRPREYEDFNYTYEVDDPKTDMGKRTIPLLAPVRDALILEKGNQEKYGYHNTVEIDGYTGFVFCNRYGLMHCVASINNAIRRIVDDYNAQEEVRAAKENRMPLLIPRFSCHITRHTFCSRLCENGTNIKVIQQVMGHSDIKTTMNIYAEVSNNTTHAVFEGLSEKDII